MVFVSLLAAEKLVTIHSATDTTLFDITLSRIVFETLIHVLPVCPLKEKKKWSSVCGDKFQTSVWLQMWIMTVPFSEEKWQLTDISNTGVLIAIVLQGTEHP